MRQQHVDNSTSPCNERKCLVGAMVLTFSSDVLSAIMEPSPGRIQVSINDRDTNPFIVSNRMTSLQTKELPEA